MQRVAQSEYDTLTIARALVGEGNLATLEPLLVGQREFPPYLGNVALTLLRATLSRGIVLTLARRGGWQPGQHLAGHRVVRGRLWERHPLPTLAFSGASLALCRWLASGHAGSRGDKPGSKLVVAELTLGDELLIYLALDLLHGSVFAQSLAEQGAVQSSTLAWLGFPDMLAAARARTTPLEPPKAKKTPAALQLRFAALCTGTGAVVLEALQPDLSRRWVEMERAKQGLRALDVMTHLGAAQTVVLDAFMTAVDQAGRRDLATFLVDAGATLLPRAVTPTAWIAALDTTGSLSDRTTARRAAGAFLRALGRWHTWDEQHRAVRFIDEGYAAAQLLLSRYEPFGRQGHTHAETVLRTLDSLEAVAAVAAGAKG